MKKKNEAVETVLCERVLSAEEVACISVQIQQELEAYIDPVKREYLPRFFKTGKGQYGEGDKFLGVVVPNTRQVAKQHKHEPFEVMATLLQSEWHECRLCALLMLVERFKKSDEKGKKEIYDFYLSQTGRNNKPEQPQHVVYFYTAAHPVFGDWLKQDIARYSLRLQPDYRAWDRPTGGSDNASFALCNIPIIWYHTDGHPDYHQPSDHTDRLNWEKMIEITKAAFLNAWNLANENKY